MDPDQLIRTQTVFKQKSEYGKEIPQSHTVDQPTIKSQSQDIGKAIKVKQPALSSHQDDCKTIKDTKY